MRLAREERTHESMITMLELLLIFLRYEIFTAAISASTFFVFLTRPFNLLGSSSKLKRLRHNGGLQYGQVDHQWWKTMI